MPLQLSLGVIPQPTTVSTKPLADASDYQIAFAVLAERGLSESSRVMLASHYAMPERVATMRHLAAAIGMPHDHKQGNLRYGRLAGRVRRELGLRRPGIELWAIATWPEKSVDDLGEFAFRMRPEVATALEKLGWVGPREIPRTERYHTERALEGALQTVMRTHRRRERWLREAKIADALSRSPDGCLRCEVAGCGFDFRKVYASIGEGYIQVHHLRPLNCRDAPEKTELQDLALV